jgi:hypothetical protein
MAITNGYTTLEEYKQRFDITDDDDNSDIESVITATSRTIDNICWQRFHTTTNPEARYYTADFRLWIRLPERIISLTALATDNNNDRVYENVWETTDYDLMPYNSLLDGEPYRWIEATPNGNYTFPVGTPKGVKITGKFGWGTAPISVLEACLLASHRLMARRNSPYGVSGAAALGNLTLIVEWMKADPDIMELLSPYIAVV